MAALDGLSILVPESRELDLFTAMLEDEGAAVLRCPLVRIQDLENTSEAERWIASQIAAPFDDVVLLTGEGLRKLVLLAGADKDAFIAALGASRIVTRGPKPARALREIGLGPSLAAPLPTSDGVLQALQHDDLKGRRMGVQAYPGDGAAPLIAALRARGAQVFPVTPYRYADEADTARIVEMIHALAEGQIGMVAFTATPQIERLFQVARETGLEQPLHQGLARTPIAAMGPVVDATLQARGLQSQVRPISNFHLKPLVRAIAAWWQARRA